MELIHNDPNNKQSIMLLHDEYKSKWGNSYVDYAYHTWSKKYLNKN
jgi:hypothetical protein